MSGTEVVTRRARTERPDRQIREDDVPPVIIEGGDNRSPADVLADSHRQIREADDRRAAAEQRAQAADAARVTAEQNAAAQAAGRTSDRQAAVSFLIESATAEQASARAAYISAREANDAGGEADALVALNAAGNKLTQAEVEKARLESVAKGAPQQTQRAAQQPEGQSPAVQAWFAKHGARFNADKDYEIYARGLHDQAIRAGHDGRSQAYVDYVSAGLAEHFGEDHHELDSGGSRRSNGGQRMSDRGDRGGDGMAPSRGQSSGRAGLKEATIPLGHNGRDTVVRYEGTPEKPTRIIFKTPEDAANFHEGAKTVFGRLYDRDPDQAVADYVSEHLQAAEEGYADIVRGEGRTYGRER